MNCNISTFKINVLWKSTKHPYLKLHLTALLPMEWRPGEFFSILPAKVQRFTRLRQKYWRNRLFYWLMAILWEKYVFGRAWTGGLLFKNRLQIKGVNVILVNGHILRSLTVWWRFSVRRAAAVNWLQCPVSHRQEGSALADRVTWGRLKTLFLACRLLLKLGSRVFRCTKCVITAEREACSASKHKKGGHKKHNQHQIPSSVCIPTARDLQTSSTQPMLHQWQRSDWKPEFGFTDKQQRFIFSGLQKLQSLLWRPSF